MADRLCRWGLLFVRALSGSSKSGATIIGGLAMPIGRALTRGGDFHFEDRQQDSRDNPRGIVIGTIIRSRRLNLNGCT